MYLFDFITREKLNWRIRDQCLAPLCYRCSCDKVQSLSELGADPKQLRLFLPLMGSSLAAFPITTVKRNVAGTSLAADLKLLTCS